MTPVQYWRCPACHLRITMYARYSVPVICQCGTDMRRAEVAVPKEQPLELPNQQVRKEYP